MVPLFPRDRAGEPGGECLLARARVPARPGRARAGLPARARASVGRSGYSVRAVDEDEETTEELRAKQLARERAERERAERAASEDDAEAHARRAEKTAYLRERLEQRARAEREGDSEAEDGSARPEP